MFGEYVMFCRPAVRTFLDGLARRFRLAIWTRLPAAVARAVVEFLFRGNGGRSMKVLTLEDCTTLLHRRSRRLCVCPKAPELPIQGCPAHPIDTSCDPNVVEDTFLPFLDHPGGILRLKVLHQKVWGHEMFRSKNFRANCTNTLLIDSSPESTILNPLYNAIFPVPYIGSHHDVFLHESLRPYLEGLLNSRRSVCEYLNQNPPHFGPFLNEPWTAADVGRKAVKLAGLQDRDLVLSYLDFVGKYTRDGPGVFSIKRRPR